MVYSKGNAHSKDSSVVSIEVSEAPMVSHCLFIMKYSHQSFSRGSLGYSPLLDRPTAQSQGHCVGVLPAEHRPPDSSGVAEGTATSERESQTLRGSWIRHQFSYYVSIYSIYSGGRDSGSVHSPHVRWSNTCLASGAVNPSYTTDPTS